MRGRGKRKRLARRRYSSTQAQAARKVIKRIDAGLPKVKKAGSERVPRRRICPSCEQSDMVEETAYLKDQDGTNLLACRCHRCALDFEHRFRKPT